MSRPVTAAPSFPAPLAPASFVFLPKFWPGFPLLLGALLLRRLPPALQHVLPACPIYQWTGLLCPGCGGTRAVLALLHGDVSAAWAANPLLLLALPFSGLYGLVAYRRGALPAVPPSVIATLLSGVLAFGMIRNLPHR